MKKFLSIILTIALVATFFCGFSIVSMAAEETDYVVFKAAANDPYATFSFKDGVRINPDTVKYAAVRYRLAADTKDSKGGAYMGQFYISPAAEPSVPIMYNATGNWETSFVDCTSLLEGTTDESIWNSASYTKTDVIRFDPLESLARRKDGDKECNVVEGAIIDIAWIAFFESETDAKAYTGTESTPAAILDADTIFNSVKSANNLVLTLIKGGNVEKEMLDITKARYLFNKSTGIQTGWWLHNVDEEATITVEAPIDFWFNAITFFAYGSDNDANMILDIECDGEIVFEKEFTARGNNSYTVEFDKPMKPNDNYVFYFIAGDNSEFDDWWFVLGSGDAPEGVDPEDDSVITMGGNTNDNTRLRPAIGLFECEAGEEETPTAAPTAAPTAEPTAVPTAAPTAAPTEAPKDKGCGSIIGAGAVAVLLAAAVVIRKKED